MKESELIEHKELRDKLIERIDVLEKVKKLLLLPDINMATTQQVADFYCVESDLIRKVLENNNDELTSDGYVVWKAENFKSEFNSQLKITTGRGNFEIEFSNGDRVKFSPRGVGLFPRRAILRIGMLLRDSEIAKEVRTQLLNIEEKTTNEQKIEEINEEQKLVLKIIYAKDEIECANAVRNLLNYKNRYINSLEDKINALTEGILKWNPREGINRMVRKIAAKTFDNNFTKAWDKIYAEMLYKHDIGINNRKSKSNLKNPTIFDVINDNELKLLVKSCVSLCNMYKVNIDDLFIDIEDFNNIKMGV